MNASSVRPSFLLLLSTRQSFTIIKNIFNKTCLKFQFHAILRISQTFQRTQNYSVIMNANNKHRLYGLNQKVFVNKVE